MRTTLTIDDRIAKALKDLAHRSNQSFKDVVNETLRAGLTAKGAREVRPYVVRPAALGGSLPGINLEGAGALGRDRRPGVGGEDAAAEVIVVDANLLIYAIDSGSPHHARARPWLEQTVSRTVPVGLPWIVILAFVRLTTRPGIMRRPAGVGGRRRLRRFMPQQPCVEIVAPGEHHCRSSAACSRPPARRAMLRRTRTSPPWHWKRGARICSADHDFARFPGVNHVNPLIS